MAGPAPSFAASHWVPLAFWQLFCSSCPNAAGTAAAEQGILREVRRAGPERYSANLACGDDQVSRGPCSAGREKTLKPLVLFPEHHLGFEAGLWVGCVKCQY